MFYRDWTVRNARELGLAGWVRNEADGTVSAQIEGPAEAVRALIVRMQKGPPAARVERIEEQEAEPRGLCGFTRR